MRGKQAKKLRRLAKAIHDAQSKYAEPETVDVLYKQVKQSFIRVSRGQA